MVEQEPFIFLINKNALSAVSTTVHGAAPVILVAANVLECGTAHGGSEVAQVFATDLHGFHVRI